ncbi:ArsR/SmtB family transcription factor [Allokutzneria albata]|uniref:Helix-turn-helix domain-containing protein n=1 Tax=Allokutzneria albata TaxID=211114 RepID=A0A1G9UQR3_ALLAB|nr:winged helix-turn-helix domain-containing protein [Allokutzneria albata]SDM62216.1 Helix-turn-helix domain-containing protein [Allokutzneria albata]
MLTAQTINVTRFDLGNVDGLRVRLGYAPLTTVLSLALDAIGGRRRGAPESWRSALRLAAPAGSQQALGPLASGQHSVLPDCLLPVPSRAPEPVPTQLERLRATDPALLLAQLHELFDGNPPLRWRSAALNPSRWLGSYVSVLAASWRVFAPLWRRGESVMRREAERVGLAVVHGAVEPLMSTLLPSARFRDGVLELPDPEPTSLHLPGRELLLAPMLSGHRAGALGVSGDEAWLAYPARGVGRLFDATSASTTDGLSAVVGPVRAALLRALDRPLTMGELAAIGGCGPSTTTYHCERLEDAALIQRERVGRSVRISRTERADALMDLLA